MFVWRTYSIVKGYNITRTVRKLLLFGIIPIFISIDGCF